MNVKDSEIANILHHYKSITVVGMSANKDKPSLRVPMFMSSQGYQLVGLNPTIEEAEGFKIYHQLKDVPPEFRKFVDVFRRPEHIPEVVDEVLEVGGVEILWLQLGITHPDAEKKAEEAGIRVISDRCLLIEVNKITDR